MTVVFISIILFFFFFPFFSPFCLFLLLLFSYQWQVEAKSKMLKNDIKILKCFSRMLSSVSIAPAWNDIGEKDNQ